MATVYPAEDLRHERKVALKVRKPELAAVVGAERFLNWRRQSADIGSSGMSRPALRRRAK